MRRKLITNIKYKKEKETCSNMMQRNMHKHVTTHQSDSDNNERTQQQQKQKRKEKQKQNQDHHLKETKYIHKGKRNRT